MEALAEYLRTYDDVAPSDKCVTEAIETFAVEQVTSPAHLEGLTDVQIDDLFASKAIATKGLAKRTVWAANTAGQIKRRRLLEQSGSPSTASLSAQQILVPQQLQLPFSEMLEISTLSAPILAFVWQRSCWRNRIWQWTSLPS